MEYHELDPNGDKILTLRPQNLQPFPGATEAANTKHSAGIPDEDALPEITATEWDKETFLLLLEILHGRYEPLKDPLPDVDACMLVKMCVMVDNYQCHKAVQGFVDAWIKCIIDTVPLSYG
ncbi:hypothetical protein E4U15_006891 [Claviceps sp. LM218 group G6]|nr:hypothetical protein E4U15_006891 [Claviceps sp. LM218 group G6]